MKAYVKIQSSVTINVTPGLQNKDVTNPDAHVADRLKVSALWPKLTIRISAGQHWYPSEIVEWNSVKSLVEAKLATIGESADEPLDDIEESKKMKAKLVRELQKVEEIKEVKKTVKKKKVEEKLDLDSISEGE